MIQASNQLIEGLEASPTMADEAKKPYLGEAYFMRAFAYFHLVRYFGDVPGFTDSTCYKDILGSTNITRNKTEGGRIMARMKHLPDGQRRHVWPMYT